MVITVLSVLSVISRACVDNGADVVDRLLIETDFLIDRQLGMMNDISIFLLCTQWVPQMK